MEWQAFAAKKAFNIPKRVIKLIADDALYARDSVEGRACYEVCQAHNVPIIVMEPLRGGCLANLPPEALSTIESLPGDVTPAQLALRWCSQFPGVEMILSGVSNLEQMKDNIRTLLDPAPLTPEEDKAIAKVCDVFRSMDLIGCTGCGYCLAGCPMRIDIPDLFSVMNTFTMYQNWNSDWYYMVYTQGGGKAGDCIACGNCETQCPQSLPIINLLEKVSEQFDK